MLEDQHRLEDQYKKKLLSKGKRKKRWKAVFPHHSMHTPKLNITSTINTERKQIRNVLVSGRLLACRFSNS